MTIEGKLRLIARLYRLIRNCDLISVGIRQTDKEEVAHWVVMSDGEKTICGGETLVKAVDSALAMVREMVIKERESRAAELKRIFAESDLLLGITPVEDEEDR